MTVNPVLLKNKGVEVKLDRLPRPENGSKPERESIWVRFSASHIADIEDQYGGLDEYEQAMEKKGFSTVIWTLCLITGRDRDDIGEALPADEVPEVSTAIGVALGIANGVDPTQGSRLLQDGLRAVREMKVERDKQVGEQLEKLAAERAKSEPAESTGLTGGEPGLVTDEPMPSSGASVPSS